MMKPSLPLMLDGPSSMRWLLALIIITTAAVYWPGLHGGFAFDDEPNIVSNLAIRVTWDTSFRQWLAAAFSSHSGELQRPLAMLTFALNHAATGLDPYWMKATNLGVHLVNTALVFFLSRKILTLSYTKSASIKTINLTAAWITAAWSFSPINATSVLLVVQRMESLAQAIVLLSLLTYTWARICIIQRNTSWGVAVTSIIAGVSVGALVKESAILLPVYAILLELCVFYFRSEINPVDHRLIWLFTLTCFLPGLLGLAWLAPGIISGDAYSGREFDLSQRLLTEGRVLVSYLQWTLLPQLSLLSLYHDNYPISTGLFSPPATAPSLLIVIGLAALAAVVRPKIPLTALGIAWFLSAHILTGTIIPLDIAHEHRNYFASFGVFIAVGDLLLRMGSAPNRRKVVAVVAVAVLALYAATTGMRAIEWSNPIRFAQSEAQKQPKSPRATYNYARILLIMSNYDSQSPYFEPAKAALRMAMEVPGASSLPASAAILLANKSGNEVTPAMWQSLRATLARRPFSHVELAALEAIIDCQLYDDCSLPNSEIVKSVETVLAKSRDYRVLCLYGRFVQAALRRDEYALQLFEEASEISPTAVQPHVELARYWLEAGNVNRAAPHIEVVRDNNYFGRFDEFLAATTRTLTPEAEDSNVRTKSEGLSPL